MSNPGESAGDEKETGRVEAFSDGVFGIAIALLVLDIKVPKAAEVAAPLSLAAGAVAAMAGVRRVRAELCHGADYVDPSPQDVPADPAEQSWFLTINGLLLMFVTLVLFPTALLAEHIVQPGGSAAAGPRP